jgi:hypothetical protein
MPALDVVNEVRCGTAVSSIVVDGAVVSPGRLPDPDRAVAAVRAELGCP